MKRKGIEEWKVKGKDTKDNPFAQVKTEHLLIEQVTGQLPIKDFAYVI